MKTQVKRITQIALMLLVLAMFIYSCKKDTSPTPITFTLTDVDGNVYDTVRIGTQTWMKQNLKVTHYRNGDAIPNIKDSSIFVYLTTEAYCDYNNDPSNSTTYGRLYNFFAVADARNLCPTGWHVPSIAEWKTLITYLGGDSIAGGKLKEAGLTHWNSPNTGATNETGFTALPAGARDAYYGSYGGIGSSSTWWSSTKFTTTCGYYMSVYYYCSNANTNGDVKQFGFSVRCIKD